MKKTMAKRIGFIVILVLTFVFYQLYNRHQITAAVNLWQSRLNRAHLIGANQATVFSYLKNNGLQPENTHGWFDYAQSPSQVKASGSNQIGPTYSAIVFHVAHTFEPLPLDWMVDLNFQFDKRGRLLFFKAEPDASGI